jgi:hypothetical protein
MSSIAIMSISRLRYICRYIERGIKLELVHQPLVTQTFINLIKMSQSPGLSDRRRNFASQGSTIIENHEDSIAGVIQDDGSLDLYDDTDNINVEGLGISTESDEERLKNLVKEIYTYRDSPVSNWIVEVSYVITIFVYLNYYVVFVIINYVTPICKIRSNPLC